jgi:Domain of unknown function (DUF4190)
MTNDPYRDGPGGPPPAEGAGPVPPEAAWMPPTDPTQPGQPPPGPAPAPAPQPADQTEPGQPAYQAPQYQPYQYPGPPFAGQPATPVPGGKRPTNGLAIAALVCSLACFVTIISAPVGAVLGHLATRQIAQTGEEGGSLAKAAIWVGWIITGLVLALCCAGLAIAIAASRADHAR